MALYIEALEIDERILDKIESKHGISFEEVEEVAFGIYQERRGPRGLYRLFGQTEAGRYLLVVLASLDIGIWRVVTARDMVDSERRLFLRERDGRR